MRQPLSHNLIDPTLHEAVAQDHQPREARYRTTYDDGSAGETTHMLFWDGGRVRSVLLADWPAEQAAVGAKEQARQQQAARHAALRASVAGKRVDALTLPELRALVEILAAGLLDAEGRVR